MIKYGVHFFMFLIALLFFVQQGLYGDASSRRNEIVDVVESVGHSVVSISTERLVVQRQRDPLFGFRGEMFNSFFSDFFDSYEQEKVEIPLGSGVIIDEEGYIVTNEHVISRASKILVLLTDGTELKATLVSSDPVNDLAILKVDPPEPLHSIKMGISDDLMVGETVVALGNPFGLGNSITTGVLSALHRSLNAGDSQIKLEYKDLIQTDALINPGNSGGALVNIDGELIGINTAILKQAQGIGFAIPVNKVKKILVSLLNFREINKVWLGIDVEKNSSSQVKGIRVVKVAEKSPAFESDVLEGDIIIKIDNHVINDVLDYKKYILQKEVGDIVELELNRSGKEKKIYVKLAKTEMPTAEKLAKDKLGIYAQELTYEIAARLGFKSTRMGILVSGVEEGGPADKVKIMAGHVIVRINQYRIRNLEELGIILNSLQMGEVIDIGLVWADVNGERRVHGGLEIR